MIISLVNSDIKNNDDLSCEIPSEVVSRSLHGGALSGRIREYHLSLNYKEYILRLPVFRTENDSLSTDNRQYYGLIWPAVKLPRRKYPVYVYLYAIALYLSGDMSLRKVAERTRRKFGLSSFSHSTLCRTLKKILGESSVLEQLLRSSHSEGIPHPTKEIHPRRTWDHSRRLHAQWLFDLLKCVLDQPKTGIGIAYRFYELTSRFIL